MAVNLGPQAEQLANGNSSGGPGVLSRAPFIFPLHFLPGSNLRTENCDIRATVDAATSAAEGTGAGLMC